MKNLNLLILLLSFSIFTSINGVAQGLMTRPDAPTCTIEVAEKENGLIAPGTHANFHINNMQSDELNINVRKLGGRARTTVQVFTKVNSSWSEVTNMEFEKGHYAESRTLNASGLKGKDVKIKVKNRSVANTFRYKLSAKTELKWQVIPANLNGQEVKEIMLSRCAQAIKVVKGTHGKGSAIVIFHEKKHGESDFTALHTVVLDNALDVAEYQFPAPHGSDARKVEVRNTNSMKFCSLDVQVRYE